MAATVDHSGYEIPELFVGGSRRKGGGLAAGPVINPSTEDVLGCYFTASSQDIEDCIASSSAGFLAWKAKSPYERSAVLRKIAELLRERGDNIARLLTLETGKIYSESLTELRGAADHFDWSAEEGRRLYGYTVAGRKAQSSIAVQLEPIGVVFALIPWNFPLGTSARKVAPALAAGCSVVLRPPEESPATVQAFVQCCHDAGLPAGAINMIIGRPEDVVEPLMASPVVRAVTFTGSTRVGKLLIQQSASTVKRLTLELGGHAPVIVLPDTDAAKVGKAAARAKFRNAGQVCVSPSRFYVHQDIAHEFTDALAAEAKSLRIGDGFDPKSEMGPLTTSRQREHVENLISDACAKGATVVSGGKRPAEVNRGFYVEPTVLTDVPRTARVMNEEPFGPIAPVIQFQNISAAVEEANALKWGLAGYVFTSSLKSAHELSRSLEVGMVGVNTFAAALPEAPFGGVKESGFGRECGQEGIREFVTSKLVHADIS